MPPLPNNPETMAKVLAETVAELGDNGTCRRSLAFAGFTDDEISKHLQAAKKLARQIRQIDIERLYPRQFDKPQKQKNGRAK